jgi:hypothetical protein
VTNANQVHDPKCACAIGSDPDGIVIGDFHPKPTGRKPCNTINFDNRALPNTGFSRFALQAYQTFQGFRIGGADVLDGFTEEMAVPTLSLSAFSTY